MNLRGENAFGFLRTVILVEAFWWILARYAWILWRDTHSFKEAFRKAPQAASAWYLSQTARAATKMAALTVLVLAAQLAVGVFSWSDLLHAD